MIRLLSTLPTALVALGLAACGGASPAEGEGDPGSAAAAAEGEGYGDRATSSRGTFVAEVTSAAPIPLNEPFAVRLALVDPESGERFEDYDEVTIDARMPAHQHGMLRDVELEPSADGALVAEGLLFHMVGHWEIHVDVRRGARVERAQLDVELEF
ncbi:MAG: hypothetical protein AAF957_13190 [Planctomycetota bacterium]